MKGSTEGWKINSEEGGELHFEKNLEDDGSERNEDTERGLKDKDDANWTSPLSEPEDSDGKEIQRFVMIVHFHHVFLSDL